MKRITRFGKSAADAVGAWASTVSGPQAMAQAAKARARRRLTGDVKVAADVSDVAVVFMMDLFIGSGWLPAGKSRRTFFKEVLHALAKIF